jgi:hypothetical protein
MRCAWHELACGRVCMSILARRTHSSSLAQADCPECIMPQLSQASRRHLLRVPHNGPHNWSSDRLAVPQYAISMFSGVDREQIALGSLSRNVLDKRLDPQGQVPVSAMHDMNARIMRSAIVGQNSRNATVSDGFADIP